MMIRESPVAFYARQVERANRRARLWLVLQLGAVLVLIAALAWALSGCSHAPSTQDQADMIRLGATIDSACTAAALSPDDCTGAREALVRLGVSLEHVEQARVMAEVWDVARPLVTAGIGWLLAGGGA